MDANPPPPPRCRTRCRRSGRWAAGDAVAQPLTRICCLTTERITRDGDQLFLALGPHPLQLAPPLDDLITRLVETRISRAAHGNATEHPWLFPGAAPGQHLSTHQLMRRLQRMDISTRLSRNTAMMSLAAALAGTAISGLPGLHPDTAENGPARPNLGNSDYAAEISRRNTTAPNRR